MYLPQKLDDGRLKPAELGPRFAAALVDAFTLKGALFILGSIVPVLGNMLFVYLGGVVEDNVMGPGRSVGRRVTRTRLICEDGSVPDHALVLKRNLVNMTLMVFFLPFVVDMLFILFGDGRRLSDRVFGTVVTAYPETDDEAARFV